MPTSMLDRPAPGDAPVTSLSHTLPDCSASDATPTQLESAQHVLYVLDRTGDTQTIWNPDNDVEVAAARAQFDALVGRGYLAYTVRKGDGGRGEQIRTFDPMLGAIILAPQLRGG